MAAPWRWPGRCTGPTTISALVLSAAASNPWDTGLGTYYTVLSHPLGQRFLIPLLTAWVPDRVVDRQIDAVFEPQTAPEGYHTHIGAGLTLRRVSMRANALHRRNLLGEIRRQAPRYGEIDRAGGDPARRCRRHRAARHPFRAAVAAIPDARSRCCPAWATCSTMPIPMRSRPPSTAPRRAPVSAPDVARDCTRRRTAPNVKLHNMSRKAGRHVEIRQESRRETGVSALRRRHHPFLRRTRPPKACARPSARPRRTRCSTPPTPMTTNAWTREITRTSWRRSRSNW
jgi:hypothetical protein